MNKYKVSMTDIIIKNFFMYAKDEGEAFDKAYEKWQHEKSFSGWQRVFNTSHDPEIEEVLIEEKN